MLDRLKDARDELSRQKIMHPIWKGSRAGRSLGITRR
jgi:hypothetical protein